MFPCICKLLDSVEMCSDVTEDAIEQQAALNQFVVGLGNE